jgi:hypothetical protein
MRLKNTGDVGTLGIPSHVLVNTRFRKVPRTGFAAAQDDIGVKQFGSEADCDL